MTDDFYQPNYITKTYVTSIHDKDAPQVDPDKLREAMKALHEAMQKKLDDVVGYKARTPPASVSPARMLYLIEGMLTSPYKYVVHIDDLAMWWRELRKLGFILRRLPGKSIIRFQHKDGGQVSEMLVDVNRFMKRGGLIRIDTDAINAQMRREVQWNWRGYP